MSTLRPIAGDGVLSRRGDLVLLCAAGLRTDALLAAHDAAAGAGGDGDELADRLGDLLTDGSVDAVAFGPSGRDGSTTTVAVFGHAFADVTTEYGEQRLALKGSTEGVRSSLPGRLLSITAGLGDAETAVEPSRWGDLQAGVVQAKGLRFTPAGAPTEPHAQIPEPVAELAARATHPQQTLAPPPEDTIPPVPAAAGVADDPGPQPELFAPPAVDRSRPFSSVLFVAADGAAPQIEPRTPLPVAEPTTPPAAPDVRPAPHPAADRSVQVLGVYCKNGHFDDPAARYCAVCGISMAQLTLVPRPGPRPPLGVLVLDDGSIFGLDGDYVIGRNPARAPEVTSGAARPLRMDDRRGLLSRAHARVMLDGWTVTIVDLGSANGTGVLPPGAPAWQQLIPRRPFAIRPGTEVAVGERRLRYESHRNT